MINNELLEKIRQIVKINTAQNILTISIEELAELSQVLCKCKRRMDKDKSLRMTIEETQKKLAEELADVYLLLEQIKIMYIIPDYYINEIIENKIERTFKKVGVLNH